MSASNNRSAVLISNNNDGADQKTRDSNLLLFKDEPHQHQQHQQEQVQEQQVETNEQPTTTNDAANSTFLASMTFASAGRDGLLLPNCDCDECGPAAGGSSSRSFVPETIRAAIREHKRQKLLSFQHKRTQNRALVRRCSATAVAVWEWTLPVSAEPLLEFGNAAVDRLLWVQRLPRGRGRGRPIAIQSIGTGIVGSSHEEKARVTLDWKEGDVMLVPSNEGKAVGWVVKEVEVEMEIATCTDNQEEKTKQDTTTTGCGGPAVFIIVKVPRAVLLDESEEQNGTPSPAAIVHPASDDGEAVSQWSRDIVKIYSKAAIQHHLPQQRKTERGSTANKKAVTRLENNVAAQLKQIVGPMLTN